MVSLKRGLVRRQKKRAAHSGATWGGYGNAVRARGAVEGTGQDTRKKVLRGDGCNEQTDDLQKSSIQSEPVQHNQIAYRTGPTVACGTMNGNGWKQLDDMRDAVRIQ